MNDCRTTRNVQFTDRNREELILKGYTVIQHVASPELCDHCIQQFDFWLTKFTKLGEWPYSEDSVIDRYKIGHFELCWKIRLACKPVFNQLWHTDKLLTSIEGISLGRSPESGQEKFADPREYNLKCSQSAARVGLHAVRGALHLEPANFDDWTFIVISGSHLLIETFYKLHPEAMAVSVVDQEYHLTHKNIKWFLSRGCRLKRVPVPKGGILLWDSRSICGSARPLKGRKHSGRRRLVAHVTMTPAIWAHETDLDAKKVAYEKLMMTSHWPSQGVTLLDEDLPTGRDICVVTQIWDIAQTMEVKQLSGVVPYDFPEDDSSEQKWRPQWLGTFTNSNGIYNDLDSL